MKTEMKRAAVSLAALTLAAGSAGAQSNLTLYGIVDAGAQWNEQYSASSGQQASAWSIESGYQSGSRFGLRGAEPLGGGWSTIFTLEGGFDATTGQSSQGGALFGRQVWAGLQARFGQIVAGRIPTPSSGTGSFDMFSAVDPFGAGFGINAIGSTFVAANALREDNAVLYATPSLGGFRGAAGYSFNRGGAESVPQDGNSRAATLAAAYGSGPIYIVATYDWLGYPAAGSTTANAGLPDEKLLQIGATWDLKLVKLYGAFASQSDISAVRAGVSIAPPSGLASYDNTAWMFGATVPLLGGQLMASYQDSNGSSTSYPTPTGTAVFDPDYSVWGLGYQYPFSRRTNWYAGYGHVSADGSLSSTQVARKQFGTGLRHRF
jgi:predicted porin